MREYELTVLISGSLDEKAATKVVKDINDLLAKTGAKIKAKTDLEKKALAYEINRQREAYYAFFDLSLDPSNVFELDSKVKLVENVVRYLLVKKI